VACDLVGTSLFWKATPNRAEAVTNLVPFFEAFGVRPGDEMYRADSVRAEIR